MRDHPCGRVCWHSDCLCWSEQLVHFKMNIPVKMGEQIWMQSMSFYSVTMIGAHHSVALVTCVMHSYEAL